MSSSGPLGTTRPGWLRLLLTHRRLLLTLIWSAASLIVGMVLWLVLRVNGHWFIASLMVLLLAMNQFFVHRASRRLSGSKTSGGSTGFRGLLSSCRRWYHRKRGHLVVKTVGRHRSLVRLRSGEFQTYFARVYWCAHCRKEWPL